MKWKRRIMWTVIILATLFFVMRFAFYGFSFCDEREKVLQMEDRYKGKTVTFEVPKELIYFEGGGPSFEAGCTETQKLAPRQLRTQDSIKDYEYIYKDYEYSIIKVDPKSTFTFVKKITVSPFGFNSAFRSPIDYYLLRDQNGILSLLPSFDLRCLENPKSCKNIADW